MYKSERHFVKTAHAQMRILQAGCDSNSHSSSDGQNDARNALTRILHAAISVEARGVCRAVGICQNLISRAEKNMDVQLANDLAKDLGGLNKLIDLYSEGLFELDPEFEQEISGNAKGNILASEITQKLDTSLNIETDVAIETLPEAHAENLGLETVYLEGKHADAANTLTSLLGFVRDDAQLGALNVLMDMASNDADDAQEALQHQIYQKPVLFENLMRPVSSLILREARYNEKSVSISYAADFEDLPLDIANIVQSFLEVLCLNIVVNGIGKTTSQISLTGQKRERRYRFSINWAGHDISDLAQKNSYFKKSMGDLQKVGGDVEFRALALEADIDKEKTAGVSQQALEVSFPMNMQMPKPAKNTNTYTDVQSASRGNLAKAGGASR